MKTLVIGSASFVAGVYAGLYLAATSAEAAGCPAAKGGKGKGRQRSAVDDILGSLGSVRQRNGRREPGGSS